MDEKVITRWFASIAESMRKKDGFDSPYSSFITKSYCPVSLTRRSGECSSLPSFVRVNVTPEDDAENEFSSFIELLSSAKDE